MQIPFRSGNRARQSQRMGATVTDAEPDAPAYMLPGVNLFASGVFRGKPWPAAVIRMIAANARRLGPDGAKLLIPPSVLGHEEDQEWLERTDLPAAGWIDPATVHVVPDPVHPGELILRGDVVNVPAEVKDRLDSGEYRFGSAEIYDDFKDDFDRSHGKALRRFALLGGEVPQVKRLGPLPKAVPMQATRQFSELRGRLRETYDHGRVYAHAEAGLDRQQLIAAIQASMPGISQAFLDSLTDDRLAELADNAPTPTDAPQPGMMMDPNQMLGMMTAPGMDPNMMPPGGGGMPTDPNTSYMAEPMSHEELIAKLTEMGQDPASLEGMDDEELQALLDELSGEGGEEGAEPETADMADGDPAAMSHDDLIAELTALGQDPATLQGMSDADLQALYTQLSGGGAAAEPVPAGGAMADWGVDMGRGGNMNINDYTGAAMRRQRQQATPMSEQRRIAANMKRLNTFAEKQYRQLVRRQRDLRLQEVDSFCEKLVQDGRVTPAHVKAFVKPLLLKCDDTVSVFKFSDGKVTKKLTEYAAKKAELSKLPKVIHFGERFAASQGGTSDEAEVARVREFADTLPESALKAGNYRDREQFVEKFSELRKKNPSLTAKQYLGT